MPPVPKKQKFDVVIVGGGLIGASLAVALDTPSNMTIALIEPNQPEKFDPQKTDLRVTALNNFSVDLLKKITVWDQALKMRAAPFRKVLAWEEGVLPLAFTAKEIGKPQLGYMVENTVLLNALMEKIDRSPNITLMQQTVAEIQSNTEWVEIKTNSGALLLSRLLVGADGYHSFVRRSMQIGSTELHHPQKALVIHIKTPYPQSDVTWQRFTPNGAQAFLPMFGQNASLVWYHTPDYIDHLASLDNENLQRHLMHAFPARLGDIRVQNAAALPIVSHYAHQYVKHRMLLIGDAAHSLHPLAGQGANLGLQDVAALARLLNAKPDFGAAELARYEQSRKGKNLLFVAGMETIYHAFNNAAPILGLLRKGALLGGRLPIIKKILMEAALGGKQSA